MVDTLLSECVIAYVRMPGALVPESAGQRVAEVAGNETPHLLPTVRAIVDAVYAADPPLYDFPTMDESSEAIERFLRARHPELSDHAIQAVIGRYHYDWK